MQGLLRFLSRHLFSLGRALISDKEQKLDEIEKLEQVQTKDDAR